MVESVLVREFRMHSLNIDGNDIALGNDILLDILNSRSVRRRYGIVDILPRLPV